MAEQLICNQQVVGSTPITSSSDIRRHCRRSIPNSISYGSVPEWPKGTDCKSAGNAFGGPNPPAPTNKNRTFVYRQMFCFCLSKPQAWHIIDARSAVHIISPLGAVSHHATACIFLRLDDIQCFALMIYRNKLRMIYKATP